MRRHSGNHTFANVPAANIQRSTFDRSHTVKTTFDAGYLIPVFVDEALPGDTFNLKMSAFARLSTPLKPFMDNLYLDTHFFAVPIRLVWDNWVKMCGEQNNPGDSTDYRTPYFRVTGGAAAYTPDVGSLSDYLGIPTHVNISAGNNFDYCSLFHRGVHLIWNEWYRDENLQNKVVVDHDDGPDDIADYTSLLKRGKRHDYFTSCLIAPQKGPDVTIPVFAAGQQIPVMGIGNTVPGTDAGSKTVIDSTQTSRTYNHAMEFAAAGKLYADGDTTGNLHPNIYVDFNSAVASSINTLRQAFQIQKMYERDARGGTRYTEIVRSHFGVISPDARLQRPEYLGGGESHVNVHPIAQTSATAGGGTAQGNLAAFGTSSVMGHGFIKSFTEHSLVIGFVSVRADMTYQSGINRMFMRRTRFDYYWPALAHLGEQAVLNQEIYLTNETTNGSHTGNEDVFGYQERYAEYRYKPSMITGKFRSSASGTLDIWHLAQKFTAMPTLGATFIEESPPIDRVVAVNTEPQFLLDAFFDFKCTRPMPVYSVPGLIDHF